VVGSESLEPRNDLFRGSRLRLSVLLVEEGVTFIARGYPEQARGLGLSQSPGLVLSGRKCRERAARDIVRRAKADSQIVRDRQDDVHDPNLRQYLPRPQAIVHDKRRYHAGRWASPGEEITARGESGWRRAHFVAVVSASVPQCPVLPDGAAISPVPPIVASALCIKPRGLLTSAQAEKVDDLKAASTEFAAMRALAMRFRGLLRGGDIELLDTCLSDAVSSGIHAMRQFAATLRRDLVAVRNAILQPWSSGQTEGQINRVKTLKRAMYGRAGTELLRARMLPLHAS
jgi:hypothetical protein